jgi:hypothetical protein
VDVTGGDVSAAQILGFRSGTTSFSVAASGFADTDETGTSVSATAESDPGFTTGDMVVVAVTMKDDALTHTSQALSVPGCTLGTITWLTRYTTTAGTDIAQQVGYATVTAGTSTGAATYTATSNTVGSAAVSGTIVRLREAALAPQVQVSSLDAQALVSDVTGTQVQVSSLDAQALVSDVTGTQVQVSSLDAQALVPVVNESWLFAQSAQVIGVNASESRLAAQSAQVVSTRPASFSPYVDHAYSRHSNISGSVTVPATVQSGDLGIAFVGGFNHGTGTYKSLTSGPTGWVLQGGTLASPDAFLGMWGTGNQTGATAFVKTMDGSETTLTWTWTQDVSTNYERFVFVMWFRNVTLAELVNSTDSHNIASSPGTVSAVAGATGYSFALNVTAAVTASCTDAFPDTGRQVFFHDHTTVAWLHEFALSEFPVQQGNTLPVTDWTWAGNLLPSRSATTFLLSPIPESRIASQAVEVGVLQQPSSLLASQAVEVGVLPQPASLLGSQMAYVLVGVVTPTNQTVSPGGVSTSEAFGSATVIDIAPGAITPTGIASPSAFGTPVVQAGSATASPAGVTSLEAFGTAQAKWPVTVSPTGIASLEAVGSCIAFQPLITYVGAGTTVSNTVAITTATYPTGMLDGDSALLFYSAKPYNTVPTGLTAWTGLGGGTSGTVANALDGGSTMTLAYGQRVTATMSGTTLPSIFGSPSPSPVNVEVRAFRSASGNVTFFAVGLSDTDETGTSVSATAGAGLDFVAGDMIVIHVDMKSDAIVHSTQVVDVPGCTLGPVTWITALPTTQGNDMNRQTGYATVVAGASTGPATYTAVSNTSGGAAVSGAVVRLREAPLVTVTGIASAEAVGTPLTDMLYMAVGIGSSEAVGTPTVTALRPYNATVLRDSPKAYWPLDTYAEPANKTESTPLLIAKGAEDWTWSWYLHSSVWPVSGPRAKPTAWFKIVPSASGTYTFTESGGTDSYGYLYQADPATGGAVWVSDDDGGVSTSFQITASLVAGSTYWLAATFYSVMQGTMTLTVSGPATEGSDARSFGYADLVGGNFASTAFFNPAPVPPTSALGVSGSAVANDGATPLLDVGAGSVLGAGWTGISVETWVLTATNASTAKRIVANDAPTGTRNWWLGMGTDHKPVFTVFSGASQYQVTAPTVINDGTWHHLVGVYNGSSIALYLDGTEAARVAVAGGLVNASSGASLTIGYGLSPGGTAYFEGDIDEVAVYDRALGQEAVAAHAKAFSFSLRTRTLSALPAIYIERGMDLVRTRQIAVTLPLFATATFARRRVLSVGATRVAGDLSITANLALGAPVVKTVKWATGELDVGVELTAGPCQLYRIASAEGDLSVSVSLTASPGGQDMTLPSPNATLTLSTGMIVAGDSFKFAGPIPISLSMGGSYDVSLMGASATGDPPPMDPLVSVESWQASGGGIWLSFTADTTGTAYLWADPAGALVSLEVWGLWAGTQAVTTSDLLANGYETGAAGVNLYVPVIVDRTYLIRVYSHGSPGSPIAGTVRLNWAPLTAAPVSRELQLTVYGMSPAGAYISDGGASHPYLYTTPALLYLDISNGPPGGDVVIGLRPVGSLDAPVVAGRVVLDGKGAALRTSVLVPELPAGNYEVIATDMGQLSNRAAFTYLVVRFAPAPNVNQPSDPGDMVPVRPQATTTKWYLDDPTPGETDSFVFIVNPSQMGNIFESERYTTDITPAGRRLVWQKAKSVVTWTFSGRITHKAQYEALNRFLNKDHPFWLVDHLKRVFAVTFTQFDFKPDPARVNYPWLGTYSITALIVDGPLELEAIQ